MTLQAVGNLLVPRVAIEETRSILMDADAHLVAQAFVIYKAGNIKKVHFRTGIVTASDTLKIAIQDIGTGGEPDGADDISTTVSSLTSNTWHTATFTGSLAVSVGDHKAVVISFDSYAAGNLNIRVNNNDANSLTEYTAYDLGAASWTLVAWGPVLGIEYDDTTFGALVSCSTGLDALETFDLDDTPDEVGNRFSFPFPVTIAGAIVYLRNYNDNGDFDLVLYHAGGSVTNSITRQLFNGGPYWGTFALTETDISADSEFRLAIKATHATQIVGLYARTFLSSAARSQQQFGAECQYTSQTGSGGWTESTTKQALVYPIFSKFDDAAGGGGVFIQTRRNTLIGR